MGDTAGLPLYMRGASTVQADQEDDQLNKAIALLQDRLFSLSCEEEADSHVQSREETNTQTYAGVLRSPPKKAEPDQLIKIRNLGTMGSMVEF